MAKDKFKNVSSEAVSPIKFKGKTTIVLKNAETGKVENEVVEYNMVTDAVARIFASNYCGQINYSSLMPIATKALGGVLCFQEAIPEDVNSIYPPTTDVNPLIAHAGQSTYATAGDDLKRGNPNNVVSGPTASGYSNTWDFAPTQGNGVISAICLTHAEFGDWFCYGRGNFAANQNISLSRVDSTYSALDTRYVVDDKRGIVYGISFEGNTLTLRKRKHSGLIKLDVISNFPFSSIYEDISIVMPRSHNYESVYMFDAEENKLTFILPMSNGSDTLYRDVINLNDNSVASDTIKVSGASFARANYQGRFANTKLTKSGRLYLPSTRSTFYGFVYSNPTDVVETVNQSGYSINIDYAGYSVNGDYISIGNSIIEGNKNYLAKDYTLGDWANYLKPVNVGDSPIKASVGGERYGNPISTGPILNKMYIGTINNLQNPVTKTSAQTMTITYELIIEE